MTMEEETKSIVARMVDLCQSCSDDDFCKECREDIQFFQDKFDFDVTEYITLSVPDDLQANSEAETDAGNIQVEKVIEIVDDSMDEFPDHDLCHTAMTLAGKIKDKARAEGDTQSK